MGKTEKTQNWKYYMGIWVSWMPTGPSEWPHWTHKNLLWSHVLWCHSATSVSWMVNTNEVTWQALSCLSYSASFRETLLLLPPIELPAPTNCWDTLCYCSQWRWPRTMSDYAVVTQKTLKCLVPYLHSIHIGWLIKCRLIIIQEYFYSSWKQWYRVERITNLRLVSYLANLPAKWFGAGWKNSPWGSISESLKWEEEVGLKKELWENLIGGQNVKHPTHEGNLSKLWVNQIQNHSFSWMSFSLMLVFPPITFCILQCQLKKEEDLLWETGKLTRLLCVY